MPRGLTKVLLLFALGSLGTPSSAQEAATSSPASQPATTQKATNPTTQPTATTQPQKLVLDLGKGVKMELVLIPAGKFMMGAPDNGLGPDKKEGPQHLVTIKKPFYMGVYAVTQEQYQAIMGNNPSIHKDNVHLPVQEMDWEDCQDFCFRMSVKTQKEVRLPSEAEWEYACRAGTTTRYYFGDDPGKLPEYAWFDDNNEDMGDRKPHPVGLKKPNPWGLYDMHGNVWQLCQDWFHGYPDPYIGAPTDGSAWENPPTHERVIRGGSFGNSSKYCSSTSRDGADLLKSNNPEDHSRLGYGFRIVVEVSDKQ